MKYSFLVPVYNVEKYLTQCIESILSQTFKDFEIILVNDGSTDSSGKICDDYSARYSEKIRVIHKENEGLVAARQTGINEAVGTYCLFVDSDDYIESNLLEEVDKAFVSAEADMVIFSFCYFSDNKKIPRKATVSDTDAVYEGNNKKCLYEALMFTPLITSIWSKAVKTSVLKNDKTDYKRYYAENMGEDQFRSISLLTDSKKIKYINKALYNYRTDNLSISRNFSFDSVSGKNMLYIYNRFIEILPEWDMNNEETIKRLQAQWLNLTIYTFNQYYKAALNDDERKAVVDFDWSSMLPSRLIADNEFNSGDSLVLYDHLINKRYTEIKKIHIKNSVYKKIKALKSRIIK